MDGGGVGKLRAGRVVLPEVGVAGELEGLAGLAVLQEEGAGGDAGFARPVGWFYRDLVEDIEDVDDAFGESDLDGEGVGGVDADFGGGEELFGDWRGGGRG